jgi:hypothetical protein
MKRKRFLSIQEFVHFVGKGDLGKTNQIPTYTTVDKLNENIHDIVDE